MTEPRLRVSRYKHEYTVTMHSAAAPAQVFNVMTEMDRYQEWLPPSVLFRGARRVQTSGGAAPLAVRGPIRRHSAFVLDTGFGSMQGKFTAFHKDHFAASFFESRYMVGAARFEVTGKDGGTTINMAGWFTAQPIVLRFPLRWLHAAEMRRYMRKLHLRLESIPGPDKGSESK